MQWLVKYISNYNYSIILISVFINTLAECPCVATGIYITVHYDNLYTKCVLYRYEKMFHSQFVILVIHKFCYL
jgi:hypothetical protein